MGNGPLDQPLVYQIIVDISVPVINAASSTTALTFIASSLPDGVFVDNITVIINAVNRFGYGPNSTSNSVEISENNNIMQACTCYTEIPFVSRIIKMLMHGYIVYLFLCSSKLGDQEVQSTRQCCICILCIL